jgi:hypothetical protein
VVDAAEGIHTPRAREVIEEFSRLLSVIVKAALSREVKYALVNVLLDCLPDAIEKQKAWLDKIESTKLATTQRLCAAANGCMGMATGLAEKIEVILARNFSRLPILNQRTLKPFR